MAESVRVSALKSSELVERQGDVRKILNSLKQKRELLSKSLTLQRIESEERGDSEFGGRGKIVLYTTSLKAIRETHERCKQVLHILQAHQLQFTVKDVFLHPDYSKELNERMESSVNIVVPQLFIGGSYIGDWKTIIEMNEVGKLEELVKNFKGNNLSSRDCLLCGGQGFVLCMWCKGSKKGIENFFIDLRCTVCNKNGLQKCPDCSSSY